MDDQPTVFEVEKQILATPSNIPDDLPEKSTMYPDADEWINPGDSVVVSPDGEIAVGPMHKEAGILYHDIDLVQVGVARRPLDVTGHYARPDIFTLHVNRSKQSPVQFNDTSAEPEN